MPPDEYILRRALELAKRGLGHVEPNPMVGAVFVDAQGLIVGEGWHERFGGPHAEVNAFTQAGDRARGGTLYVTLEPCCHHGKTPPCTDAVLRSGVRRVVVAMRDPFPKVAGGGLHILEKAGVNVEVGLLESEARKLNAPYLKLVEAGRPWLIAKWAMSWDGKIATRTGDSKWISNEQSRAKVHELRGRVDAILVGAGTLRADDPLLTARPAGLRVATRIVLSYSGELPDDCQLLRTAAEAPILIYTTEQNSAKPAKWKDAGATVEVVPSTGRALDLLAVVHSLGQRRLTNVLVEGGAETLGRLVDQKLIDEVWIFLGAKLIGGRSALGPIGGSGVDWIRDAQEFEILESATLESDFFVRGRFKRM